GRCARPILSSAPQCVPGCARNARSTAANAAHRAGCPALPRRWHIRQHAPLGRQAVVAAIAGIHRLRVTEVAQDVTAATLLRVRVPLHALQPALLALPSLRECMPVDREGPVRLLQELPSLLRRPGPPLEEPFPLQYIEQLCGICTVRCSQERTRQLPAPVQLVAREPPERTQQPQLGVAPGVTDLPPDPLRSGDQPQPRLPATASRVAHDPEFGEQTQCGV